MRYKPTYTCRTLPTALSYKRSTPANVNASVAAALPPLLCFCPPAPIHTFSRLKNIRDMRIVIATGLVRRMSMTSPANIACQRISVKYLCLLPRSRDPALAETAWTILFQPLLAKPKLLEHRFAFSKTLGRARFTSRRSKCCFFFLIP